METAIFITILRIWFAFILLGSFFMAEKSQGANVYKNCDAKYNVSLKSKYEYAKPVAACNDYACEFRFEKYTLAVVWRFKLRTDVKNTSSFCTRGSLHSEKYGELIHSSKVKSVMREDNRGNIVAIKSVPAKKGYLVIVVVKYKISPEKKRYTEIASGIFKTEILLNCKEDKKPSFCLWFPSCIWQFRGDEQLNLFNCTVQKRRS